MDAIEAILSRQSVREYTGEVVPEEVIETLLRAAMNAPSAGKERPWHFVVIRTRETLDEIARVHTYAQMMRTTPVAIVVCGDTRNERHPGLWVQDCSAATENLLLAAQALGYGAVWVGVHPVPEREEKIRRIAALPEWLVPLAIVPVGRPKTLEGRDDRFDPTRVRRERWS